MSSSAQNNRLRDLVTLMGDVDGLHRELLQAVRGKTDAMRRSDVPHIQACSEEERSLVIRIQEREGLRRQLMDLIGRDLGLSGRKARTMNASRLAQRLDEPFRTQITEVAATMKNTMTTLARENRVAGLIAREVLGHLRGIFGCIGESVHQPVGYAADGAVVSGMDQKIIETVA